MALKISLFTQQNAFANSQNIPPTYPSWVDNMCVSLNTAFSVDSSGKQVVLGLMCCYYTCNGLICHT